MQRTRHLALLLALILTVSLCSLPVAAAEQPDIVQQQVQILTEKYGTQSVQYALLEDGKITVSGHAGAYSRTENRALTEDTMYGIASISKLFPTVAVLQLCEQGKLYLDSPVTQYLPEFKMADSRYQKITLRMLLNHSSGLMGTTMQNMMLAGDADTGTHDDFLKHLKTQKLKAEPGAFSVYCNDGFTLAELVIERVSGLSFTDYVAKYITEPLGLVHTKTPQDTFDRADLAKTYLGTGMTATPPDTVGCIGAGGIYSTAKDLCRFLQLFLEKPGIASGLILQDSAQKTMVPEAEKAIWPNGRDEMLSYGLGWDSVHGSGLSRYNIQALTKGGDTGLYHGSVTVLPQENMAVAVLSSGGSSVFDQLLGESLLRRALAAKNRLPMDTPPAPPAPMKTGVEVPTEIFALRGSYLGTGVMEIDIAKTGTMTITATDAPGVKQIYEYQGNGVFVDKEGTTALSFVQEGGIRQTYLQMQGYQEVPGLGRLYNTQYVAQRIGENPLTGETATTWAARNGKSYCILNEKYTSLLYGLNPMMQLGQEQEKTGYLGNGKIVDATTTEAVAQIPGMLGRDLAAYRFYTEDGVEYMTDGLYVAMDSAKLPAISRGKTSACTIQATGNARWYAVGQAAGKTMAVTLPQEGSFAVYNNMGICVASSHLTGDTQVKLPEDGRVVFAGTVGEKFQITMG
ncbi:MAG: serine hydrolase domain-containing protein [Oscillospiraceae bacterium]